MTDAMLPKVLLLIIGGIGIVGHLIYWAASYSIAPTNSWAEQLQVIMPWCFFDGALLPKEHDYLRINAIKYLFADN